MMELDRSDEEILSGEFGETRRVMLEILIALGKVYGAERLIPVSSVQVSGASYKTIGDHGLEWLNGLDARAVVPAFLNPIGMPRDEWRQMGIDASFAKKQTEILDAYRRLGITLSCTCTPYYHQIVRYGDHLAWSESSAVAYANSVLGARTNREGGPSALASALIGKTPLYGLHIMKNRLPDLVIEVDDPQATKAWGPAEYGALGYLAGKVVGNRIPFFRGIRGNRDRLKALGAAMAATGAVALFHVEDITPEARVPFFKNSFSVEAKESITISVSDVAAVFSDSEVNAVAIGCPHLSEDELRIVAGLLSGKKVKKEFFVFTSREMIDEHEDLVGEIEASGAYVYADTCMVVSPATDRLGSVMTNSGKALSYLPAMCGVVPRLGTIEECVRVATE
jgi:hypothetical protein